MGILSDSITLLSKAISLSTNFKSKFASILLSPNLWISSLATGTKAHKHLPRVSNILKRHNILNKLLFSDLKMHNNEIQKLLVIREENGRCIYCSRLSVDLNHNNNNGINLVFPITEAKYFYPFASCKTLLLCHMDIRHTNDGLWNPRTNEIKTFPKSTVPRPPVSLRTYIDAYGFGFDPVASQDYKVIRFLMLSDEYGAIDNDNYQVEMYSLKSDSWKEITYPHSSAKPLDSIHINGFCYWFALDHTNFIMSFDFANEEFSTVRIPLPVTNKLTVDGASEFLLAEFHGSLAALVYTDHHSLVYDKGPFEIEILVWDDKSSWTRVSIIVIDVPNVALIDKPLGLFNNDQLYLLGSKGELLVFDCGTRELKDLGLKADHFAVSILPYVETQEPIRIHNTDEYSLDEGELKQA